MTNRTASLRSSVDYSAEATSIRFSRAEKAHAARVVELLAPIIPALAEALQPRTEVILHDLTNFPDTIAAIGGSITDRRVGGPPTNLAIQAVKSGQREHQIRYRTETADGMVMRSSSLYFRGPADRAVASLCINTDVHELERAQRILTSLVGLEAEPATQHGATETFPLSVESLTESIMQDAIAAIAVPIDLMKKSHKLRVVQELEQRGFFAIREAAELAAVRLDVSRYTIYNYLNELEAEKQN